MYAAACRVTHALQGYNGIADLGASSLADALKINTCLRELRLVSAGSGRGVWLRAEGLWFGAEGIGG